MGDFYFVPEGRRWPPARLKRPIWRFEAGIIGGLLGVFRLLPFTTARWIAGALFALFGGYSERAARAEHNLRIVFPDVDAARIRQLRRATLRHLGWALAELAQMDTIWDQGRVEFVEQPGAISPAATHTTVYVTAHVSGWETTPLVARAYGVDIPVIYSPERNPYVDDRLNRLRAAYGSELVASEGGIRAFVRALRVGKSVGMTADTRLDGGEMLDFLGQPAPTNTGPAWLAERYRCHLVPALGERLAGGRYRVTLYPPIRARDPAAAQLERVRDTTRQLNELFGQWIRERPGEWLCLKHRWSKSVYKRLHIR